MKVKCIDNYLSRKYLTVGKVYNVELAEKRGYTIVDDTGELFVYPLCRFEVVIDTPVVTTLKTIRAIKSISNGKKRVIQVHAKYIVLSETEGYYFVINDSGQIAKYSKSCFEIVNK